MDLVHFQMVDSVEAVDRERLTIRCLTRVPESATILDGHFPGFPVLPGVLMIETMAQSAGLLLLAVHGGARVPLLYKVDGAKLSGLVEPGTALTCDARITHSGAAYAVAEAELRDESRTVARTEVRLRLVDPPNDTTRNAVLRRLADLGLTEPFPPPGSP